MTGDLEKDIAAALNRASCEGASGTPDFILAQYLLGCLLTFNQAIQARAGYRGEAVNKSAMVGV